MSTYLKWTQQAPAHPPTARELLVSSIATDLSRSKVIVWAGNNGGFGIGDATSWDGSDWTSLGTVFAADAGGLRAGAYDETSHHIITFGGCCGCGAFQAESNRTYDWDGALWTLLAPTHAPSARLDAHAAWCGALGAVVLFGGLNTSGKQSPACTASASGYFSDLWSWSGVDWTNLAPAHSPSARAGAAMVKDGSGNVILFGGYNGSRLGDTWKFDGTDWTQLFPAHSPSARTVAAAAYFPALGKILLYGGNGAAGVLSDLWSWSGTDWTQESFCGGPGALEDAAMTFDPTSGGLVLFGGDAAGGVEFNKTWLLTTATGPDATTVAASGNVGSTATLNGTVNPQGSTVDVFLDYGTTTSYGSVASAGSFSGGAPVSTPGVATGLTAGVTYHFRVRVVGAGGCPVVTGSDLTFVEGATPAGSAYLHGYVDLGAP